MAKRRGMRIGRGHTWRYSPGIWKETKVSPHGWKFTYENSKTRTGSWARWGQGMPVGSKLIWKIRATQYAKKVSPNRYILTMKGKKYMGKYKVPRKKWKY